MQTGASTTTAQIDIVGRWARPGCLWSRTMLIEGISDDLIKFSVVCILSVGFAYVLEKVLERNQILRPAVGRIEVPAIRSAGAGGD